MTSRRSSSNRLESLETRICLSAFPPVLAPTDLTVTAVSRSALRLQWTDNAVNETGHMIFRSTDQVNWIKVITTAADSVSWTDHTLEPGVEYFYRIKARAEPENSRYSNTASATTLTVIEDAFAKLDATTGELVIRGTSDADSIYVNSSGANMTARQNGSTLTFNLPDVKRISIFGYDGNDKIVIDTSAAFAYVAAGAGNDTVYTNFGDDYIDGGAGDDLIKAGEGNDTVTGGTGNDTIYGQAGADLLRGGDGDDRIIGGDGDDTIYGDLGNDRLYGQGGLDDIFGGGGSNLILQS